MIQVRAKGILIKLVDEWYQLWKVKAFIPEILPYRAPILLFYVCIIVLHVGTGSGEREDVIHQTLFCEIA